MRKRMALLLSGETSIQVSAGKTNQSHDETGKVGTPSPSVSPAILRAGTMGTHEGSSNGSVDLPVADMVRADAGDDCAVVVNVEADIGRESDSCGGSENGGSVYTDCTKFATTHLIVCQDRPRGLSPKASIGINISGQVR